MTSHAATRHGAVAIHGSQTTAEVAAGVQQSPSTEARYAHARRLVRDVEQLLAEAVAAPDDYTARLARSLAGDLADVLDELARSVEPR